MAARKRSLTDDLGPLFGGLQPDVLPAPSTPSRTARSVGAPLTALATLRAAQALAGDEPAAAAMVGARQVVSHVDAEGAVESQSAELGAEPAAPAVLSVAGLAAVLRGALERSFPVGVWVEGEVAGAKAAPSGHLYFALKDESGDATMDVVMYRGSLKPQSREVIKDGAKVRLRGKPVYWAPRGRLQFVADAAEPTGQGALLLALEQLKQRLQREGLFALERKRPLPSAPRIIGVVTSASGAVIHDIRKVAFRRGGAHILLAPAQVQGQGAAQAICKALAMLQRVAGVDVIIVGRGGGSADDLMCFNDEALVRAIAACTVPVVSAVGHEVDVTLTDHVADRRAATPSQAAEFVVQDRAAQADILQERTRRLSRAMRSKLARLRLQTSEHTGALRDPRLIVAGAQQRLDEHRMRMTAAINRRLRQLNEASARRRTRLGLRDPRYVLAESRAREVTLAQKLAVCMQSIVARARSKQERTIASLDALSPLRVLGRGYALATVIAEPQRDNTTPGFHAETLLQDARNVAPGARIRVRLGRGSIAAQVLTIAPEPETPSALGDPQ